MAPGVTNCGPDIAGPGEGVPPTPTPESKQCVLGMVPRGATPTRLRPSAFWALRHPLGLPAGKDRASRRGVPCSLHAGVWEEGAPSPLCLLWLLSSPQQMPV